jgi:selenocysteine lyase/cysteine desulfurase
MKSTRREFLGAVAGVAAAGHLDGLGGGISGGLGTGVTPGEPRALTPTADDPLGVRPDFPVTGEMTYLDGAYITPSPRQAVDAAQAFLEAKARSPVSLGGMLGETVSVRQKFARLVGATEAEIGLLFATSDGENIVTRALEFRPGDNVVVDDLHYETTYLLYQELAESVGLEVRTVRSEGGAAPVEAFAEFVDERTRLISVAWVSHQNGYVHDLKGLADLAHGNGAYLYADAIQGVGMVDLDVRDVGIDFFAAGTYKWLLGGYGVAPFYVREGLLPVIGVDRLGSLHIAEEIGDFRYRVHSDARKYGYATFGFGAVYQLDAALEYLLRVGVAAVEAHTVSLAHRLHAGLSDQGYELWTPGDNGSAIVAFDHQHDVDRVRADLESANVKVSLKAEGVQIRAGIALFNNSDDIDALLRVTGSWR